MLIPPSQLSADERERRHDNEIGNYFIRLASLGTLRQFHHRSKTMAVTPKGREIHRNLIQKAMKMRMMTPTHPLHSGRHP